MSKIREWSVRKALEEWRGRKHELAPMFATAGIAPDLLSMVDRVLVDIRRAPPAVPQLTGNKQFDDAERARHAEAFYSHYDDLLFKAESLLRHAWVPEAEPIGKAVAVELNKLRYELEQDHKKSPNFDQLETLLKHYAKLDHPTASVSPKTLDERHKVIIDVAGFPLLVQHEQKRPLNSVLPPLTTDEFHQMFQQRIQAYLQTPWLQSRLVSRWMITIAIDEVLARKKAQAEDELQIRETMSRWPSPSVWMPNVSHVDQFWYLLLIVFTMLALVLEYWWMAGALIVWLNLSLAAFRRENKRIETRRVELVTRIQLLKRVRDRFAIGGTTPEKLEQQLKLLDDRGDFTDPPIVALIHLHPPKNT